MDSYYKNEEPELSFDLDTGQIVESNHITSMESEDEKKITINPISDEITTEFKPQKPYFDIVMVNEYDSTRKCNFCDTYEPDHQELAKHIFETHFNKIKVCSYCVQFFIDEKSLKNHILTHSTGCENKYSCSHCKVVFSKKHILEAHEYQTHEASPQAMYLQNYYPYLSVLLKTNVRSYITKIISNNMIKCVSCKKDFTQAKYLSHIRNSKSKHECCQKDYLVCEFCCNVYYMKKSVIRHLQLSKECTSGIVQRSIERTTLPFQCKNCKESFLHAFEYQQHLSKCINYACIECNIEFKDLAALQVHKLENHKMTITGFTCIYCNQFKYGNAKFLQDHIRRNHPDKHLYKYGCVHCGRIFKHPNDLFKHFFGKHHELRPFNCKICSQSFKKRKMFTIHIKMMHNSNGKVRFDEQFNVTFTENDDDDDDGISNDHLNQGIFATDPDDNQGVSDQNKIENDIAKVENDTKVENDESKQQNDIPKVENDTKEAEKTDKQANSQSDEEMIEEHLEFSSDDEPLIKIKSSKRKKRVLTKRGKKKKASISKKTKTKPRKTMKCSLCQKIFQSIDNYNYHIKCHFRKKPNQCIKCGTLFHSPEQLDEHMKKMHKNKVLQTQLQKILQRCQERRKCTMTPAEKIRSTMRKVVKSNFVEKKTSLITVKSYLTKNIPLVEPHLNKATIGQVTMKKYIENFNPEPKTDPGQNQLSIQPIIGEITEEPKIKLLKSNLKHMKDNTNIIRLAAPRRFKREMDKMTYKVTMREVSDGFLPYATQLNYGVPVQHFPKKDTYEFDSITKLNFGTPWHTVIDFTTPINGQPAEPKPIHDDYDDMNAFTNDDNYFDYDGDDHLRNIPEVAQEQEVQQEPAPDMLKIRLPHKKVVTAKLPKEFLDVQVATLIPEKPYYKVVKLEEILNNSDKSKKVKEPQAEIKMDVPEIGKTLISANPYKHLLGGKIEFSGDQKDINAKAKIALALKKLSVYKEKKRNEPKEGEKKRSHKKKVVPKIEETDEITIHKEEMIDSVVD